MPRISLMILYPAERLLWPGRASPSASQLLAFSPGAALRCTHGMAVLGDPGADEMGVPSRSYIGEGNGNPLQYSCLEAFDCVDHNKWWKILKEMGIPDHLTCLFRNLYAGQEATVRTGLGTTDWFQIGKGVRQGCILSPCLFNMCSG